MLISVTPSMGFALAPQQNQVGESNAKITDTLRTIPLGVFQQLRRKPSARAGQP
jgi:hypothetical protein